MARVNAFSEGCILHIKKIPRDEQFGLISQIRRSAVSIPSNIAEGVFRNSKKELHRFLLIALGSSAELQTQLLLITEVYGLETDALLTRLATVQKMLIAFIKKL